MTTPHVRLRIDLSPSCSVGPGKVALLAAIDSAGSLSGAARAIGMSYRRAARRRAGMPRGEGAVVERPPTAAAQSALSFLQRTRSSGHGSTG